MQVLADAQERVIHDGGTIHEERNVGCERNGALWSLTGGDCRDAAAVPNRAECTNRAMDSSSRGRVAIARITPD